MISIPMRYIRAAMAILDLKDRREYCRGVWVEFNGAESRIVATSGPVLFVARFECDVTTDSGTFLMGDELKKIGAKEDALKLGVHGDWVAGAARGTARPGVRYPEWRRVIPLLMMRDQVAQFDPALLMKLEKAGGWFTLTHNGQGAAMVSWVDSEMFAIINPRRDDKLPPAYDAAPEWMGR